MTKDDLVNKVKAILKGIDEDECASPDGWWETSEGASFGKTKLAEVVAILEALEQPAQEPVAWIKALEIAYIQSYKEDERVTSRGWRTNLGLKPEPDDVPLYTHPAPSWQGLSDDEIEAIMVGKNGTYFNFARAIEQASRIKNGY